MEKLELIDINGSYLKKKEKYKYARFNVEEFDFDCYGTIIKPFKDTKISVLDIDEERYSFGIKLNKDGWEFHPDELKEKEKIEDKGYIGYIKIN